MMLSKNIFYHIFKLNMLVQHKQLNFTSGSEITE